MLEHVPTRTRGGRGVRRWTDLLRVLPALFLLFLLPSELRATHAMGGEMGYTCLGGGRYEVTLDFYRDCRGIAAPTTCANGLSFRVRSQQCGADFYQCFNAPPEVSVITPICPGEVDRCLNVNGTYGVQRYRYKRVVDLNAWAGCGTDWLFSWELCCRNNAITSLNSPGQQNLYLETRMNNTSGICNNAPVFTNAPTPFYCLGERISYNPGAVDPDGDSLVYALIPARGSLLGELGYRPGYSAMQPIRNAGGPNAVILDPLTGTMTVTPNIQQVAVVSYLVQEYRNGQLIGETTRDIQFVIRPCPDNAPPTASGINGGTRYDMRVCAGEPVTFTLNTHDPDAGQNVTLTWNSGIPGGSFSSTSAAHPVGTFTWMPTVADIGNHVFTVTVQDDDCPLVGRNEFGYAIRVMPPFTPAVAGADQDVCSGSTILQAVAAPAGISGRWTVVSGAGTFADASLSNTAVSGLGVGANVFRWTIDHELCGVSSDDVTVVRYDPGHPAAQPGPDQALCLPTNQATLAAVPTIAPATGSWTLIAGAGSITTPSAANSTVTGLAVGVNRFRWSVNNGSCGTTRAEMSITVYSDQQGPAAAGADVQACLPAASVTLNGNTIIPPATGQWTRVSGSGTISDPSASSTTITGLVAGTHVFRWTVNNGVCASGISSDDVTVRVFASGGAVADAGADQALCGTAEAQLQAAAVTAPAVGQWTLVSGAGTFNNAALPNATVSGLAFGANVFQWTVDAGSCAGGGNSDRVTITRYDPSVSSAQAGADRDLCTPVGTVRLAAVAAPAPASGTWTVVSGGASVVDPNAHNSVVNDLVPGTHVFRWTVSNGPCPVSPASDEVVIRVFDASAPVAAAGPDQEVCTPVSSITLAANTPTAPATGRWTVISGTATLTDASAPNSTVTGLAPGTIELEWRIDNGACANPISTDRVRIVVYDGNLPAANAGADIALCTPTRSTRLNGSTVTAPATGRWTLVSGTGNIVDPTVANTMVTGLGNGYNVFRWSVNNGACGVGATSAEVTVLVYDGQAPAANAGPDKQACSSDPTVDLEASLAAAPATGVWSIVSGAGTISDPEDPHARVTAIPVGTHVFRWTVDNGPCGTTTDDVVVTVYDTDLPAPVVGVGAELCIPVMPNAATLTADPVAAPAVGRWSLMRGAGIIADPTNPTTGVTYLGIGVNTFRWTISNGTCPLSSASATVDIVVYDASVHAANAGADQAMCSPMDAADLQGSALSGPATGVWTVVSGSGTFVDAHASSTRVEGLGTGSNVFRWTVFNGPCGGTTSDEVQITVFDGNAQQADAGPDVELCGAGGSITLQANQPSALGSGRWTVEFGGASIVSPTDPHSAVTGLHIGRHVFVWTIDNGACGNSVDRVTVRVYDPEQAAADAGADQQRCTPNNNAFLVANAADAPATGQWTVIEGGATVVSPDRSFTAVNGLTVGRNVFRWTIDNGSCGTGLTTDDVEIILYDAATGAAQAGADRTFCSDAVAGIRLEADAVAFPAIGSWHVAAGSDAVVADPHDPRSAIQFPTPGVHRLVWTVDNGPCGVTRDEVVYRVFDVNAPAANAGADLAFCTPVSEVELAALPPTSPATGMWVLVSGSGTLVNADRADARLENPAVGITVLRWTVDNGGCGVGTTSDELRIAIHDANVSGASAGADQRLCTPVSSTTMAASPAPFPAEGTWTLISGAGTFADIHDPNSRVSDLGVGNNLFRWTVTNGPCPVDPPFADVLLSLYDGNAAAADAGTDQRLCLPVSEVQLNASTPQAPAQGTWTLVQGTGVFADPHAPNTTVSGASLGVNIYRWTVDNGACANPNSSAEVRITIFDAGTPVVNAGPDQALCTPAPSTILAANAPVWPAQGTWTVVQGSATITDPHAPNTTITAIGVGINVLRWTVDNGPCAGGNATDEVRILLYDRNMPAVNAGADQRLCGPTATTTLQGSALTVPATGQWTVVSGNAVIADPSDPNSAVSGLGIGRTVLAWQVNNGPCNTGSMRDELNIDVFDPDQPAATAGNDIELCHPGNAAVLNGSAVTFPATGRWTLVSGTANIVSPSDPRSGVTDLTVGLHRFVWTVDNGPCPNGLSSDTVVVRVFGAGGLVAAAGDDIEICTPTHTTVLAGSIVQSPAVGTWSFVTGSGSFANANDPATAVSGLTVGIHRLRWTVDHGICGGITTDEVEVRVFDVNQAPADAGADIVLCTPVGPVQLTANALTAPATGRWVRVSGEGVLTNPDQSSTTVTGLGVGTHVFQWTVFNGPCANGTTSDRVTVRIHDANAPLAHAGADQGVCTPNTSSNLNASTLVGPATGLWTVVAGSGIFADATSPRTSVSGMTVGANVFRWTVDNGACGTSDALVTITQYDQAAPIASAGPDQAFCGSAGVVSLNGNTAALPSIGSWSAPAGMGTFADPQAAATTISGLPIGLHPLVWTIDNGVCGISRDTLHIRVYDPEALPALAGADQEYCTPQDSTWMTARPATMPAVGTWSLLSGAGLFEHVNDPLSKVSGMAIGHNVFLWTMDNGVCPDPISRDTITVTIYSDSTRAAFAGLDFEVCLPQRSTRLNADEPLSPATGAWTILSGPGVLSDPRDPRSMLTDLAAGITVLVWDQDNGPCPNNGVMSDTLTITIYNPFSPMAFAGEDIAVCTPVDTVHTEAREPTFPGRGTWTLVSGSGTIADPHAPRTAITDLGVGTNVFTWYVYNGMCPIGPPTLDTLKIRVYDADAPAAAAGSDVSLCAEHDVRLEGNAAADPATGYWQVITGSATFADSTAANTAVSDLGLGRNVLVWTIDNGACGITRDTLSVTVHSDTIPAAHAGTDLVLCGPLDRVLLEAQAVDLPALGSWQMLEGAGTIEDATRASTFLLNAGFGTHRFTWAVDNGPCGITRDTLVYVIHDGNLDSVDAGADQEHCAPQASTVLAATPVAAPAVGRWIVLGEGSVVDPSDPASVFNLNGPGIYSLVWSVHNGPCTVEPLTDTLTVRVYHNDHMPAMAGDDLAFCSDVAVATEMAGIAAIAPATGLWTVEAGDATIIDPSDPNTRVEGLLIGHTVLRWSVDNGPCGSSFDEISIAVHDPSEPPAFAGNSWQQCMDTTYAQLDAHPVVTAMASGHWALITGHGLLDDATRHNAAVTDLRLGHNAFVWTVENGPCGTTADTVIVELTDCSILVVPDAFSPNGDGVNDKYVVKGLEYYPENSFVVFNRWGAKIFERRPYRNDWDGKSENPMNWGEDLPESTYYFVLEPGKGKETITGYIYLRR